MDARSEAPEGDEHRAHRPGRDDRHPLEVADAVRHACLAAALAAWEDAGLSGLCAEGRWEVAVDAVRRLDLGPVVSGERGGASGPRR